VNEKESVRWKYSSSGVFRGWDEKQRNSPSLDKGHLDGTKPGFSPLSGNETVDQSLLAIPISPLTIIPKTL
jgi:hypothetical protein